MFSRAAPKHGSSKQVVMLLAKPYIGDTRVKNEAESLATAGYDVTVLSWDRSGIQQKNFEAGDVNVVSVRLLGGSEFSKLSYALSAVLLQFYSVVWCLTNVRERYTLHCNDFNTLLAGAMLKLAAPGSVNLVYDCHELTPSVYAEWYGVVTGLVAGAVEKGLLRFVDVVFTVSPPIRNYLSHVTTAPST